MRLSKGQNAYNSWELTVQFGSIVDDPMATFGVPCVQLFLEFHDRSKTWSYIRHCQPSCIDFINKLVSIDDGILIALAKFCRKGFPVFIDFVVDIAEAIATINGFDHGLKTSCNDHIVK